MQRYTIGKEQFIQAVKESFSIRQVLIKLGIVAEGGNYKIYHSRKKKWGVDDSHFTGQGHLRGKEHDWSKRIPLEEILVADSDYMSIHRLKQRILKSNLIKEECAICRITEWNNQKLSLHLDHKNGINNDHRLENLRLLCPNCHSQTETYCRRKSSLK